MRLDEYLSKHKISQSKFAEKLNPPVTPGLVSQWVCGTTRITLVQALQIRFLTKGEVTEQDCADLYKQVA